MTKSHNQSCLANLDWAGVDDDEDDDEVEELLCDDHEYPPSKFAPHRYNEEDSSLGLHLPKDSGHSSDDKDYDGEDESDDAQPK